MKAILGKKIGMTQIFDEKGDVTPVTVVEAGPCYIVGLRTQEKDGYTAIQVGFGNPPKKQTKAMLGILKDIKVRYIVEFRVDNVDTYQVGQKITASEIFAVGDMIHVSGDSIGKGFMGTIRRWHHHRGPMSHGSKSHRIPGSIGAGTTPGRVYKGRRMAGRLGGKRVTGRGLRVVRIDADKNLVMLSGSVPGAKGNIVEIVKA